MTYINLCVAFQIEFPDKFIKATADFREKDVSMGGDFLDVPGYYLPTTGNFIFSWFHSNKRKRKMVLVSNTGNQITCGYLNFPAETWRDPTSWAVDGITNEQYFVENFEGE